MRDIMFEDIDLKNDIITNIDSYEKSYGFYEVYCNINGEYCRVLDTRYSRCSDLIFKDTQHSESHAKWLIKKLGGKGEVKQSWNHNPSTWDDDQSYGDEISYIGDGLDCADDWAYWW